MLFVQQLHVCSLLSYRINVTTATWSEHVLSGIIVDNIIKDLPLLGVVENIEMSFVNTMIDDVVFPSSVAADSVIKTNGSRCAPVRENQCVRGDPVCMSVAFRMDVSSRSWRVIKIIIYLSFFTCMVTCPESEKYLYWDLSRLFVFKYVLDPMSGLTLTSLWWPSADRC